MKAVSLKCPDCNGVIEVDEGFDTYYCPYCGTKILLTEQSEAELNAKIKAKEFEHEEKMAKMKIDAENERYQRKQAEKEKQANDEKIRKFKRRGGRVILILTVCAAFLSIMAFVESCILAGITGLCMVAVFICAWLMGMQYISFKGRDLHALLVILGLVLVLPFMILVGNAADESSNDYDKENALKTFVWPKSELAQEIPKPESNHGLIHNNSESFLYISVYGVTPEMYASYLEGCIDCGFTLDTSESDSYYYASNENEDRLELFYSEKEEQKLSISLEKVKESSNFRWSKSKIAKTLPVPEELYGYVESDDSDNYSVCVYNVSKQQFNEYVDACWDKGYQTDHNRSDDYFSAEDKNENDLTVRYNKTFNKMSISVHNWDWD